MSVPFVTSRPLDDLCYGLSLLGLWWLIGIEQLVWLPIAILAIAKLMAVRPSELRLNALAWGAIAIVVSQLLSLAFIVESFRLVTFARNLFAYSAATAWIIALGSAVRDAADVRKMTRALAVGISTAGVVGLLGIAGVWRPAFTSPLGMLLPPGLRATTFGTQFATRSTGDISWFVGVGEYYRVESFFLFATFYSLALIVCVPMLYWLSQTERSRAARTTSWCLLALAVVNLIFTTGRVAILSLLAGLALFLYLRRSRVALALGLGAVIGIGALALMPNARRNAALIIQASAYARGEGSVQGRGAVYAATLRGILERPLFGWGTERDVPGLKYPAGSHSNYLGTVYKHGVVGLAALLAFLTAGWRATRQSAAQPEMQLFFHCARWAFVAMVLNGLTDAIDLDIIGLVMAWTVIALAAALSSSHRLTPNA